jgi:hypothetical protein
MRLKRKLDCTSCYMSSGQPKENLIRSMAIGNVCYNLKLGEAPGEQVFSPALYNKVSGLKCRTRR